MQSHLRVGLQHTVSGNRPSVSATATLMQRTPPLADAGTSASGPPLSTIGFGLATTPSERHFSYDQNPRRLQIPSPRPDPISPSRSRLTALPSSMGTSSGERSVLPVSDHSPPVLSRAHLRQVFSPTACHGDHQSPRPRVPRSVLRPVFHSGVPPRYLCLQVLGSMGHER